MAGASSEYGLNGRPTNVSRVSIFTGVSRKEISRVRALLKWEAAPSPNRTSDAIRLLSCWYQEPDFVTATGEPRALPAEGEGASFATLWRRYGGDVLATSMRKELERAGTITTLLDSTLRAEPAYLTRYRCSRAPG